MGVQLQTVQLPAERALKNVNAGIDDGEMSRIAGLEKLYPNMIRVPETIMDWEFSAFSKKQTALDGKWSSLRPYSVAYIIGWKILERNVPADVFVTKVKNTEQLFGLLEKQRTDIILYERWGGLKYIKDNQLQNVNIQTPPLAVRNMYIYLHKKHEKLVPKLAEALKAMKQDGTYQRIYEQTLAPLVKGHR